MSEELPSNLKKKKIYRPGVGFRTNDNFKGKTFGGRVNKQGPMFNPTQFKKTQHKG